MACTEPHFPTPKPEPYMAKKTPTNTAPDADAAPADWVPTSRMIADVIFASRGHLSTIKAKALLIEKHDVANADEGVKQAIAAAQSIADQEDAAELSKRAADKAARNAPKA